jgi:hypothetical protein
MPPGVSEMVDRYWGDAYRVTYLPTHDVRQNGGPDGTDPLNPPDESTAVTYAIWGPFGELD